tara:strand:+ start:1378 stop:2373 length:996 start_codon:yes stop_codon:yes gene_type:complete
MKNMKIFAYIIILILFNSVTALSDISASTPTNLIQKIASATSFTSTAGNNTQNINEIQNTTNAAIDVKQIKKTVNEDAKKFGLLINEAALSRMTGEDSTKTQLVKIGGPKNIYEGKKDLKPNLDTIVYDTGLMTLSKEAGHYNNDNTNTIFNSSTGSQQARIKVYVDFKRKVLWGDIESRVTLTGASQMNNTFVGGSSAITALPVDKELTHTLDTSTGNALTPVNEPYPWYTKHATTSLVRADGTLAPYFDNAERLDMQKNLSHGSGGDDNVYIGARFSTTGSGTPGQATASFEASHGDANDTSADFADGVVRYSATTTITASKYTGEKSN